MREDELDRSVTVFKLRAARERIRAREGRCETRKAFGDTPAEKKAPRGLTGLGWQRAHLEWKL